MINQEESIQKFLNNIFKNSRITDIDIIKDVKIIKVGNEGQLFIFDSWVKIYRISPMLLDLITNTFGFIELELLYRLTTRVVETKFNMDLSDYITFEGL
jgi:hypothetical protein